ncbi:hypothetical protein KUTeg_022424 [Tegillarca granosa]|uniref:Uncharacterized protein n=1 Tax=Tegillarca granosa TaxID=220873 RepID=A0ABQ9E6Y2_TEGGR|nr:hypothetical protein KUTeg_022424 [Tegillarca granosa]
MPPAFLQDPEMASLHHQLDIMLDSAYRMIDIYERQCEKKGDQFAFDSAIAAFTEADRMSTRRSLDAGSSSDQESFVSATDVAFSNPSNRDYFRTMGRQLLEDLLLKCDRDTEDFVIAYDNMLDYVSDKSNWGKIEEELRGRGVKCFSFYDIVLDFMLMDAFDDLTNPPSSVTTVINNRWLSNGFKETALSTAVWSVLKAKRRMLKFSDGFIAHFYSVSEYISPVLTWGFLGPQSDLKDLCLYFKVSHFKMLSDLKVFLSS